MITPRRKPQTSIIIITWNQKKLLKKSLPLIFNQTFRDFEVIVVDSGSTDNSLDLLSKYRLKVIQYQGKVGEEFSYSRAFNLGAKKAQGEYVVRLSGDAIPQNRQWLAELLKPLSDPIVAGVYSRQIYHRKSSIYHKFLCFIDFSRFHCLFEKLACRTMFWGASCALRKKVWQKIPFNEKFPHTEDVAWALEVAKKGYRTVYAPQSGVNHSHDESLKKILTKKRFWEGLWLNAKIYFKGVAFCLTRHC